MILSPASACPHFRRDRAMTLLAALRRREMRRLSALSARGKFCQGVGDEVLAKFDRRSNPIILEVVRRKPIFLRVERTFRVCQVGGISVKKFSRGAIAFVMAAMLASGGSDCMAGWRRGRCPMPAMVRSTVRRGACGDRPRADLGPAAGSIAGCSGHFRAAARRRLHHGRSCTAWEVAGIVTHSRRICAPQAPLVARQISANWPSTCRANFWRRGNFCGAAARIAAGSMESNAASSPQLPGSPSQSSTIAAVISMWNCSP